MNRKRSLKVLAGGCFFLSGAAGLMYEIIWMRMLGLVFGHTVFAVTTVLAAFMAGLALGATFFGRVIDRGGRPLKVYGLLEAGIGMYSLFIPFFLAQAQHVYLFLYRTLGLSFLTFSLAQFVLVFLILLVPTTLMGASLPVMAKFFVARLERIGRTVGDLYALNTFGAVAGSAAAGFFLLPAIGVGATTILAAGLNVGVGLWAIVTDLGSARDLGEASVSPDAALEAEEGAVPQGEPVHLVTWLILGGIALSGAASMVYEVAWTRALSLVIGSSIYAFSAMLTTFLVGLALGSFLFARVWGKRKVGAAQFAWLEMGIGLAALALVPAFGWLPDLVLILLKRLSLSASGALATQFALSFIVMIVPTTLIGAAFPCAIQVCARALPRLGRDIGQVYSANSMGTIVGAVLAGFLLVPWLGMHSSIMTASAVNVAVGATILAVSTAGQPVWRRAVIVPVILLFLGGVVFLPRWHRGVMVGGPSVYARALVSVTDPAAHFRQHAKSKQLLYYREGINTTVSVERTAWGTSLSVNGKVDASNGMDMATQLMLGHLGVFLHPKPERALVIGLGSGVTVGALAQHSVVREIDVVELEPAVVEASKFFEKENRSALRDPRVRVVIGDGRNFILASQKKYDVISSEPSNPWMAGVANLFSLEFYRLARQRLASDGIMIQWVHGYALFPRDLKMIVNTFREVFPHATLWRTLPGDYLLVGTASPLSVDYRLLEQRIKASEAVRKDIATLWWESPLDLLTLFFVDEDALANYARGSPQNTDDTPILEFAAPLALYADTVPENERLLRTARTTSFPPVTNFPVALLDQRRLHFARVYWARGEKEEAVEELRRAGPSSPGDVTTQLERAKLLFSLGEVAEATEELVRLERYRPQDRLIRSYLKAGGILRGAKAEEALPQYGRTVNGNANTAEAHNNLGVYYTRLGIDFREVAFFDLAVDSLEAALRIEPQSFPVQNNLGNAYFELGKLEEAARAYKGVLSMVPDRAETHFNLGLVYEKQGMRAMAAREFETASALKPHWSTPKARLTQMNAQSEPPGRGSSRRDGTGRNQ